MVGANVRLQHVVTRNLGRLFHDQQTVFSARPVHLNVIMVPQTRRMSGLVNMWDLTRKSSGGVFLQKLVRRNGINYVVLFRNVSYYHGLLAVVIRHLPNVRALPLRFRGSKFPIQATSIYPIVVNVGFHVRNWFNRRGPRR